jgi:hypothetical protein
MSPRVAVKFVSGCFAMGDDLMFRPALLRCFLVACALAFITNSRWGQTKTTATQKTAEKTEKPFRGRLPNGWPKLGLDSKQVAKIYSVQEKFHTEIEELEHRLEELKTKQGEEMLAVLTAEQQAALKAQKEKPKATATKPSTEE